MTLILEKSRFGFFLADDECDTSKDKQSGSQQDSSPMPLDFNFSSVAAIGLGSHMQFHTNYVGERTGVGFEDISRLNEACGLAFGRRYAPKAVFVGSGQSTPTWGNSCRDTKSLRVRNYFQSGASTHFDNLPPRNIDSSKGIDRQNTCVIYSCSGANQVNKTGPHSKSCKRQGFSNGVISVKGQLDCESDAYDRNAQQSGPKRGPRPEFEFLHQTSFTEKVGF